MVRIVVLSFIYTFACSCTLIRNGVCDPNPPYNCGEEIVDSGSADSGPDGGSADAFTDDAFDASRDAEVIVDADYDSGVTVDSAVDSGFDSGIEDSGGPDAQTDDSGVDSGLDSGRDSGLDSGLDAGTDSGPVDSGTDSGPVDSGTDSGPIDCVAYPGICVRFTDNPGNPAVSAYWSRIRDASGTVPGAGWEYRCVGGVRNVSARVTECLLDIAEATTGRDLWFYPSYDGSGATPVVFAERASTGPVTGVEVYIAGGGYSTLLRALRAAPGEFPPSVDSVCLVLTLP